MTAKATLILTNSKDETSDFLCSQLKKSKINYARFNTDDEILSVNLVCSKKCQYLKWKGGTLEPGQVCAVVFRRPRPLEIQQNVDDVTRQHLMLEWNEAMEGFLSHVHKKMWINHPANNYIASHKAEQLSRASRFGLNVPDTLITNDPASAFEFVSSNKCGVIVKPLASGFIERDSGDTMIYTSAFDDRHLVLLDSIRDCPVLFQHRVSKEFDARVTVVGDSMIAVALYGNDKEGKQRLDIRRNNMLDVRHEVINIPHRIEKTVLEFVKSYNLLFAALDFGITESGEWYFFEINPNGQWAWLDICADAGISGMFVSLLKEMQRHV